MDALYGDDPGDYRFEDAVRTLQAWANISRGVFQPENIKDIEKYVVEFTFIHAISDPGKCDRSNIQPSRTPKLKLRGAVETRSSQ